MDIKEMASVTEAIQRMESGEGTREDNHRGYCQIDVDHPDYLRIQEASKLVHELIVSKLKNDLAKGSGTEHVMQQINFLIKFLDDYTRTSLKIALTPKVYYSDRQ